MTRLGAHSITGSDPASDPTAIRLIAKREALLRSIFSCIPLTKCSSTWQETEGESYVWIGNFT